MQGAGSAAQCLTGASAPEGSTDHGKVWFGCLGHGLSKRNGRSQIGLNTARDIQEAVSTHDASGLCAAGSYPDVCPVQSTGSRGIVLDTSSPKKKRRRRRRRKGGGGGQGNPKNNGQQNGQSQNAPAKPKGPVLEDLTAIDPQPRLSLEYRGCPPACRLIDLFCPIGRGQRGLIVSPPKAGKTTLLKDIAHALLHNHKDVSLTVLLVDERPEEVTDFRRTLEREAEEGEMNRCQVRGSSNDHDVEQHVKVSIDTINECRQRAADGEHVVVLLDSLTRLGRAFNRSKKHASSGRTMSGGIDSKALEVPKQLFGSARNTEEAGSLTIIATCLVDTGSQGDQLIFEEFKGTGNMELILDRKIAEKRLFPAINLAASGTRKDELLLEDQEQKTVTALRRRLLNMKPENQVEQLLAALKRFPTNEELVAITASKG
jgi:transcription termination factor Rho